MRLSKSSITRIEWSNVCLAIQYAMSLYVVFIVGWKLLNIVGIIPISTWLIQPTFYGPSLIIVLILQFGMSTIYERNSFVLKMCPYMTGLITASLLSLCELPICLLLMLIIGFWGVIEYQKKCDVKEILFVVLVACMSMEVYSVVMMLAVNETTLSSKDFMSSGWLEVILLVTVVLYCLTNSKEGKIQKGEKIQRTNRIRKKYISEEKESLLKVRLSLGWISSHFRQFVIMGAEVICVLALGLFLFYFVTNFAGVNKILHSGEEVYILQHCEDTSLVLSLVEDEVNHTYTIEFQEYIGANNQKVQVLERSDEIYQLVFVEPQYTLGVKYDSVTGQLIVCAENSDENLGQCWRKEEFASKRDMYRFVCGYGVPLSYQMLTQSNGMPEIILNDNTEGCEFFVLEHSTADEFVTKVLEKHGGEFTPTLLMETMIGYLGGWSLIIFLLIVITVVVIVQVCKRVGDQFAILYVIVFAYMLAYASMKAIALYMFVVIFLLINKHFNEQGECEKDVGDSAQ